MKITKQQLEKLIKEAVQQKLKEAPYEYDTLDRPSYYDERMKDKLQGIMLNPAKEFLTNFYKNKHGPGKLADRQLREQYLKLEDMLVAAMESFHL